jgi:hypothetical protein
MTNGQDTAGSVVNNLLNEPAARIFPICTALATALWTVLRLFRDWANAGWVGIITNVVIGMCLYVIEIVNILLLAVAVVQVTEPAVSG